ncbi:hypothetical protein GCM10009804_00950 [Kribbella hippodromi]|uniref:PIN domain-containing protein n=1 Tax=Kribbella hippodromi TaxID=434347 RepID=A0ABN2BVS9_9ACTN
MLRLTLDTYCVIVAAQDLTHRAEIDQLVDLAQAGKIELWLTTAYAYDQSTAPADKHAVNLAWLAERPCIGTLPGPFRIGLSPIGGHDVISPDSMKSADEKIRAIVLPELLAAGKMPAGRRMHDVQHLSAHHMAGNDAFVTNDHDMLTKQAALQSEVGITVLNPAAAVTLATGQGSAHDGSNAS